MIACFAIGIILVIVGLVIKKWLDFLLMRSPISGINKAIAAKTWIKHDITQSA
jgi:hypothetical protein